MPPSQTRSRSGCLTCKTRRKKCDEAKPFCQRCERSGIQCSGYSYLGASNDGRVVKLWTQPAYLMSPESRPITTKLSRTSRHGRTSSRSVNSSSPDQEVAQGTPGAGPSHRVVSHEASSRSDTSPDLFNSPFDLDLNYSSSITTTEALENWWNIDPTVSLPSNHVKDPTYTFEQHPVPFSGISTAANFAGTRDLQYDHSPKLLTAGQASLFQALFSLSDPTNDFSPDSSAATIGHPPTSIPIWPLPVTCSDESRVELEDEGDEDESVKQIIYGTMQLDMNAQSNALPYVLESYAAWVTRTAFEPKKAAPGARDLIMKQFSHSEDSRWTVITLGQVVRTLAESTTWGDGLESLRNLNYEPAVCALKERVHQRVSEILSHSGPMGEQELSNALQTIGNVMEIASIHYTTASLMEALDFMGTAAPLFRFLCPDPLERSIQLQPLLLQPIISLRHYAIVDIFSCVPIERNMLFHYDTNYDPNMTQPAIGLPSDTGLQWLHGIPNAIVIAFARINMMREQGHADPQAVTDIENILRSFVAVPSVSSDPFLTVARIMVQECWRQVTYIYLYMGACLVDADDMRVRKALSKFLRLLEGTKQGHTPDAFLMMNCIIGGLAACSTSDREVIRHRMLNSERCKYPGAQGNIAVKILEYVWLRSDGERRPAVWGDWQVAARRATPRPSSTQ